VVSYRIVYTKRAVKDVETIKKTPYAEKAKELIALIRENPYQTPPAFERLQGDLQGAISRRINIQHRLVYQVLEAEKAIKILSLWSHYERMK
jgi:Txe/YoeB family toxin of toxin-antitoxin system